MRSSGKIAHWNDQKGYGFIEPGSGGDRVFVHISAFEGKNRRPAVNDPVSYSTGQDRKGRARAERVRFEGQAAPFSLRRPKGATWVVLAALFLVLVAALALTEVLPGAVFHVYLAVSVLAFLVYAWDKRAAQASARRVPEATLHWIAILGGWPGALAAQQLLRHKSSKASFLLVFIVTIALNIVLFAWIFDDFSLQDIGSWLAEILVRS
jgi:uncharacterized membrane protein YsdA (DUF1294 family)/cold shock CspA family protein